ncbi:MAG: dihydroorotate dehydrogenase electron transfer subunit [Lachnospiraceae bacterium]|nr:dihydroorotate dehydrogenase electron transfer subunit [Lachnospiraceae bacterium]
MKLKESAEIISQERISDGIYSIWLKTKIAALAKPGQFVMVYPKDPSRLLPRPISICDAKGDDLRLVYRIQGGGTREFSGYQAGGSIDIMGPLGNGFPVEEGTSMIVGGGIGIPPLLFLARSRQDADNTIVLGYRDNNFFLLNEFIGLGNVHIAMENAGNISPDEIRNSGSNNSMTENEIKTCINGNVLDSIKMNALTADTLFACGPAPMLKALKEYAFHHGLKAYLSLEQRMACGIGACLSCVCETKDICEHSKVNNKRVCREGPVFSAEEVVL